MFSLMRSIVPRPISFQAFGAVRVFMGTEYACFSLNAQTYSTRAVSIVDASAKLKQFLRLRLVVLSRVPCAHAAAKCDSFRRYHDSRLATLARASAMRSPMRGNSASVSALTVPSGLQRLSCVPQGP